MIASGSLEYALARMHARLGQRPPESVWRSIERSRDIAPILDLCRQTSLRDAAASLSGSSDLHAVDRASREAWRRAVAEALEWMPPEFAAALRWLRVLPLLPFLAHLARGGTPAPWMHGDDDLAGVCASPPVQRAATIAQGFLAPLSPSWIDPTNLYRVWYDEWQRRLPRRALRRTALGDLVQAMRAHFARFRAAQAHEAPQLRRDLEARLTAWLRRRPLDPVAAFAWLGLVAVDLERLRGELARRVAFPHAGWVT